MLELDLVIPTEVEDRLIMTPDDLGFYEILNSKLPPTEDGSACYIARSGSGVMEAVSYRDAIEYALGGEYDEYSDDADIDEQEWG